MKAICMLNDVRGKHRGVVRMTQISTGVEFVVKLWDVPSGKHGFHVHRSGNLMHGSHTLCDHYTDSGKPHRGLNDPNGHNGDLGNLIVDKNGECDAMFLALYLCLAGDVSESIIGRSLVVHAQEDDLGRGLFSDSKINGHSGDRLLYGIIGIDEDCTSVSQNQDDENLCSIS